MKYFSRICTNTFHRHFLYRFVFDIFKTVERPESKELIRKLPLLTPKVKLLIYQKPHFQDLVYRLSLLGAWFQVPQQTKGEECGFFVLYYISLFLESAPDNSSFSKGFPHFVSVFIISCYCLFKEIPRLKVSCKVTFCFLWCIDERGLVYSWRRGMLCQIAGFNDCIFWQFRLGIS